jgi:hypothetical protein
MATISAIRDGIATRLAALTTDAHAVRVVDEFGGSINVSGSASVAVVEYAGATYDSAFDGQGDALNFTVTLLVGKLSDRAGRLKIDALSDPTPNSTTSVRAAVTGNLGGVVSFATVTTSSGYREYEIGTGPEAQAYLGVEFTVAVMT